MLKNSSLEVFEKALCLLDEKLSNMGVKSI